MEEENWGFTKVWNESLERKSDRPMKVRNNLWASELGKAPIDLWLKMKGTEPTNPPNARSLRKFEAGNIWEWIVKLILIRAGILQDQQKWLSFQYPGLLEVTGKLDFIAGGKPDWNLANAAIDKMATDMVLPETISRGARDIIAHFAMNYPNGLASKILEVKSVSSFMFDSMERSGRSSANHRKQNFHYLKATGMKRGDIVYVCRDDCRMMEFPVLNPSPVEDEYRGDIELLTGYMERNEQPPLEKLIVFDEDLKKFATNWNVGYSGYLTMLYGFKDQREYDEKFRPMAERWNRVMGRVKAKKKMTAKNDAAMAEIREYGFDLDKILNDFLPAPEDEAEVDTNGKPIEETVELKK